MFCSAGRFSALAATTGALLLLAGCGSDAPAAGSSTGSGAGSPAAATGAIGVHDTPAGTALVNSQGRTLYAFAADTRRHSNCEGSCLDYWPPVPGSQAATSAQEQVTGRLGTIKRSDGSTQLTVNGYPMYTYVGDSATGQANGQGTNLSGGLWWVVAPDGTWITDKPAGSTGGNGAGMGY